MKLHKVGCVEKYRFQILLDVADFRGVLFHAVKDKFNVAAVQLHKLCFDKLCFASYLLRSRTAILRV